MGRRSRKRGDPPEPAPAPPRPRGGTWTDRVIAAADQRPKAPWHPFPLVELCVLAGIGLIIYGFLNADDRRGRTALLMGLVLASLAGLDTAVRDHFAGFRSHSTLLAGIPAVLAAGAFFFAGTPWPLVIGGGLVIFAAGFWFFREQFRRRSGGRSFKV